MEEKLRTGARRALAIFKPTGKRMAMAERPPNDQLHPFFRPRAKVDQEAESPCVSTTENADADRPQATVTIPTIFQQPPPIKATVVASKQPTKRTASRKQSSPCSPYWPDSDIFEGGHVYQREPSAEELIGLFVGYHEESQDPSTYSHPASKQSHRKKSVSERSSSSFFARQRSLRSEQEMEARQRARPDVTDLKCPLLSRSQMLRLLDKMYPEGWRSDACLSLFDYLYPVPTDEDALPTQDPRSFPWRDKYRPLTIDGLLGNSSNCTYLRDWLLEMKVSPIVAPLATEQKTSRGMTGKASTKAKKSNIPIGLQDFIVEDEHGGEYSQEEIIDIMNVAIHDIDDDDQDFMPTANKPGKRRKQMSSQIKKMEGKARSNLILLVGCHGVGKTASVYTAANEVGYDVFEINAGQKRNAKDILAMVGEMAESHQVSFDHVDRSTFDPFASFIKANPDEQAPSRTDVTKHTDDKPVSGDIGKRKRGRPKKGDSAPKVKKSKPASKAAVGSGDITRHFLRMKVKSLSPPPETPTDSSVDTSSAAEEVDIEGLPSTADIESKSVTPVPEDLANEDQQITGSQAPSDGVDVGQEEELESLPPPQLAPEVPMSEARNPKQSLILLEEVDILYEEDKTFWSSVISLAHKSKRPIVMTCNDIGLVPFDLLALQTTLYFELPSIEATTQYLQLVCIAEGYLIDPSELYYLCIIYGQDLRKLLNSLELWSRKQPLSGSDKMSLGVYPFLIDQIIGRDETFHDEIATTLAERRAITAGQNTLGDLSLETMAEATDTQSYTDAYLKDSKADQIDEIDEYGPSKDNVLGYKILWKTPTGYDHWDMDSRIAKAASTLNQQILPDIAITRSTSETTSILAQQASTLIAPLLPLRSKVQDARCIAAEYLPYVLAICKSDNAMLMAQTIPMPGQLRSTRRRPVRRYLSQLSEEQIQQLDNIGKLHTSITSVTLENGIKLHSRFEEAIRSNLAIE